MKIIITIPAYNEEKIITENILKLNAFLKKNLYEYNWKIVIADNASTDKTGKKSKELAYTNENINYFFTPIKGKGEAVIASWQNYNADIYAFMDTDLSTDLSAFPLLIANIALGKADISIGSRFLPTSSVKRSLFRKIFSQGYKIILKLIVNLKINDAPCGFKAINKKIIKKIVPQIKDKEWFFDTELLIRAQRRGYKIIEIPIKWKEYDLRKSKVNTFKLSWEYFKKVWKMRNKKNIHI